MKEFAGRHFLLIVENISVPFDKRVWREALALKDNGAEVSVVCPIHDQYNAVFEVLDDINIYRFAVKFSNGSIFGYFREYFTAFFRTFGLFNKINFKIRKVDVIHVANPPDIFWPLAIYVKALKKKFIFDEHDLTPETFLSKYSRKKITRSFISIVLRFFEYLSYRFANTIISTNESYKENARRLYPKSAKKTHIVRNGPDTRNFFKTDPNPALKKGKSYLFAYIGIMGRQDGVDYVLHSAYYLINFLKFTDFIIYLIGKGDDLYRLKELTRIYQLEDNVVFTGRIPDQPALEILSTADICLSPDPFNPLNDRSTMNKVMEYMSLSKSMVSFSLKEAQFSAKDAALYVRNNDVEEFAKGILKLVRNPELREEMGAKGKIRVDRYLSWQKQVNNLYNAYRSTLSKKMIKEKVTEKESIYAAESNN